MSTLYFSNRYPRSTMNHEIPRLRKALSVPAQAGFPMCIQSNLKNFSNTEVFYEFQMVSILNTLLVWSNHKKVIFDFRHVANFHLMYLTLRSAHFHMIINRMEIWIHIFEVEFFVYSCLLVLHSFFIKTMCRGFDLHKFHFSNNPFSFCAQNAPHTAMVSSF